MKNAYIENLKSKRGVAVIIVLGLLALMMLMGVAFSISMRIERRSAGNYVTGIKGKQLALAALSRAIADIESSMGVGDVFPPWDSLVSSGGSVGVTLEQGEASEYIPDCFLGVLTNAATWVSFPGGEGQYAYRVINCSDLLDANFVGGNPRAHGTNVNEIQISSFPSIASLSDFVSDRDADMRYESLPELRALNRGFNGQQPDYFVTYSRFINDTNLVYLGGSESDLLSRRSEIESGLASAVSGGDATFIFENLIDYIDTNSIPFAIDGPYVERVPMLNEVWVKRLDIDRTPSDVEFDNAQVNVEMAYPFAQDTGESFDLEFELAVDVVDGTGTVYYSGTASSRINLPSFSGNPDVYRTISIRRASVPLLPVTVTVTNSIALTVEMEIKFKVLITSDGDQVVDAAPYPYTSAGFSFSVDVPVNSYSITEGPLNSWEVIDPRFNWELPTRRPRPGRDQWVTNAVGNTEDNVNQATLDYFASNPRGSGFDTDTDMNMRVSDRGSIFSVGELGSLLRSKSVRDRFMTVRLYNMGATARDPVFERFTMDTNGVARGLVNVSSVENAILASAFIDAPIGYPRSSDSVSSTLANDIAQSIYTNGPYSNIGEIGDMDWGSAIPGLGSYSEQERESIIAHTCNMIGTRQNYFLIIIAASPAATQMGRYAQEVGMAQQLGEKRAVVEIWRDPLDENNDGKYEWFVRFFKWVRP